MIVVGDVVIAAGGRFEFVSFSDAFVSKPLCVNLEGAVARPGFEPPWSLHNAPEWIKLLSGFTLGPVFAANNHILDVPDGVATTRSFLGERGIGFLSFRVSDVRVGNFVVDRRCNRHALTAMVFGRHHDAFELLQHVQVRDEGGGRVTLLVTLRTTNAATDVIWQRLDLRNLGIDWRAQAGKNRLKVVGGCQASS